jgi:hypothetical protein
MIIEKNRDKFFQLRQLDKFMIGHNGFIAGGCFKNIFENNQIKDVDMFFESAEEFIKAEMYLDKNADEFRFFYENKNVKAYKHIASNVTVELCRKIFGKPKDIIAQFDFTIVKFVYYREADAQEQSPFDDVDNVLCAEKEPDIKWKVACDDSFFEHLHLKRLVIDDKIPFPMSTLERSYRYARYGYFPCRETKVKLAIAIHDLSPEQLDVNASLYDGMD